MNRRHFIHTSAAASLSFLGLQKFLTAGPNTKEIYGDLVADPAGILDLPAGFSYEIISKAGDLMDDGLRVPGVPDGMGAFPGKDGRVILVRNHELSYKSGGHSAFRSPNDITEEILEKAHGVIGDHICDGGTTNVVYNPKTKKVEKQFLSLIGTDRNCAGGVMPWGSWITCEEPSMKASSSKNHGYCFEVKATDDGKLQKAEPLKALGRFRHEAVALDPKTGILYLTEDTNDGLLYRFIPKKKGDFRKGKLQALAVRGKKSADLRNFHADKPDIKVGKELKVKWIDIDEPDSKDDSLRIDGYKDGAAVFARGEGIIYTEGDIYICCTEGGPERKGQIFKLTPSGSSITPDTLELFLEPEQSDLLTNGDNVCDTPWGGLVICEDLCGSYKQSRPHVRGVTKNGEIYTIARNAKNSSEFAGSCFSPDGDILFVNMQGLGLTIAITGPWKKA